MDSSFYRRCFQVAAAVLLGYLLLQIVNGGGYSVIR